MQEVKNISPEQAPFESSAMISDESMVVDEIAKEHSVEMSQSQCSKSVRKNRRSKKIGRTLNERTIDKGEYLLIHRINPKTNRMNQILSCKTCGLTFPKLCNLRDHIRIHTKDFPFMCELCNKGFTQAGNRDRHQAKRVCQKKTG